MSTLYLVATPIGNLSDFSPRAVEVLQSADRIGCEDTRTSGKLLQAYAIQKPLFSFHQHNEHHKVDRVMEYLAAGETIALITDAGMPGLSDPGFLAARAAHQNGYTVSAIPGPDALTTALAASGLPSDRFLFEGFLPAKKGRQTRIQEIADADITTVLYESPHRILKLLTKMLEVMDGTRMVCMARELTKAYEEVVRCTLAELADNLEERTSIKGEIVLIVAGKTYSDT
ncbi:MAG: 16S rRNA (cytidine(1402)-2'-O)-methyltransferase [Balneolaceae bacterium]